MLPNTNETALAVLTPEMYDTFDKMAKDVVQSGFTKLTEFQVKYIFMKGFELQVSPMQALDGINNIMGKPTCSAQFMLGLINRSGQLEDMKITVDDIGCTVTMKRKGRSEHIEIFTMKDAAKMQLDGKDPWKKQPKTMMKWRAVAACARVVFPDVIQGLYTHEEMGAEVNVTEDGDMIVVSKAEPQQIPATVIETPPAVPPSAPASQPAPQVAPSPYSFTPPQKPVYGDPAWTDVEAIAFKKECFDKGYSIREILDALGGITRLGEWKRSRQSADAAMQAYVAQQTGSVRK